MRKLLLGVASLFATVALNATSLIVDPATYDVGAGYKFENVWIQSRAGGFPTSGGYSVTDMSRGMAVKDGKILITKRIAVADAPFICQVLVYDGATGNLLKEVALPDTMFTIKGTDGVRSQTGLPANDIQIDDAGNILIANYTSNLYTSPYQIYMIDIDFNAGTVTNVKPILNHKEPFEGPTPPANVVRLDYFGTHGDMNGNGYIMSSVWGTVAGVGNTVLKWDVVGGVTNDYFDQIIIKEYFPAAATGNDTGSRVTPLDENLFYLDGQLSFATLYDIDGNYVDGFKSIGNAAGTFMGNATPGNSGVDEFMLGGKSFMVYSYRNTTGSPASSWAIAELDLTGANPIKPLTAFPAAGMGTSTNGVRTALPRIEVIGDVAHIYVYGCNNGLAYYKFSLAPSAVHNPDASKVNITVESNVIKTSEQVASIEVISLTGQKMSKISHASAVQAPATKGVYIVNIVDNTGAKKIQKISIN